MLADACIDVMIPSWGDLQHASDNFTIDTGDTIIPHDDSIISKSERSIRYKNSEISRSTGFHFAKLMPRIIKRLRHGSALLSFLLFLLHESTFVNIAALVSLYP